MALKPFSIFGTFSGRTTPISGGPRMAKDKSEMEVNFHQLDQGEPVEVLKVKSIQTKRDLVTYVTIKIPGQDPATHEIHTKM